VRVTSCAIAAPPYPAVIGSRSWTVILAALTALLALSIDIGLPAQPAIAHAFDTTSENSQLTLSVFMFSYACAQLIAGYLSDALGRRRVLVGGLVLFTLAGVACTLAPTIGTLIVFRGLQGICAAAGPTIARAMVRDTQPAAQAARMLSLMLAAIAIAPMIAPVIGGGLLDLFGWRSPFAALAIAGAALLAVAYAALGETLPPERRQPPSLPGLVRGYLTFFRTRGTRLPILIAAATFAGQFAYISDSPFVLIEGYGVPAEHFGFYFASTALALMLGSLGGGRLLRAGRSPGAMVVIGSALLLAGGALTAIGTRIPAIGIYGFLPPMLVYFFGIGLTNPSATALAMEPVPQLAGTASAALGFVSYSAGAIAGYATTKLGGSSPRLFGSVVLGTGTAALALALLAAALRSSTNRDSHT